MSFRVMVAIRDYVETGALSDISEDPPERRQRKRIWSPIEILRDYHLGTIELPAYEEMNSNCGPIRLRRSVLSYLKALQKNIGPIVAAPPAATRPA